MYIQSGSTRTLITAILNRIVFFSFLFPLHPIEKSKKVYKIHHGSLDSARCFPRVGQRVQHHPIPGDLGHQYRFRDRANILRGEFRSNSRVSVVTLTIVNSGVQFCRVPAVLRIFLTFVFLALSRYRETNIVSKTPSDVILR